MAINETYFNKYEGWRDKIKPEGEIIFIRRSDGHVLSPSIKLLQAWQNRNETGMTWEDYTTQFLKEMQSQEAQKEIERIAKLAEEKEVWLACSCSNKRNECHRFIVMDLILKKMSKKESEAPKAPRTHYNAVISWNFNSAEERAEYLKIAREAGGTVLYTGVHKGAVYQKVIIQKEIS